MGGTPTNSQGKESSWSSRIRGSPWTRQVQPRRRRRRPNRSNAFRQRVDEIVEEFRAEPVTPQRFLELENALHAAAMDTCRHVLEREANRLEGDDKGALPGKVRYRKETYRINKKTPARIATRSAPSRCARSTT